MGFVNLLRHTADIQQRTVAQTDFGTANPTYSDRITSLPCLVQGKVLVEVDQFNKLTNRNGYILYCDYDSSTAAITEQDRVIWQSRTFEIHGIKDGGGQARHFEIEMLEVE